MAGKKLVIETAKPGKTSEIWLKGSMLEVEQNSGLFC